MPFKLKSGVLVYRYGERGSGYRLKGARASVPQDFPKLKEEYLKYEDLFEDPEFPANKKSLGSGFRGAPIEWKRPHEFLDEPAKFFVGGASRFDVKQGELGNCWLLAAVANLTLNAQLFHLIVPEDNSFAPEHYAGIFHFRFWKFGKWVDVVVDDRLPTRNGKLVFMRSVDKVEMWSALLEKAYAKIHGSYDKLIGGEIVEALEDFTGGLSETCRLDEEDISSLFPLMMKAFSRNSFLGCSIDAEMDEIEGEGPLGLVKGHAYSITGIRNVLWDPAAKSNKKSILKPPKSKNIANNSTKSVRLLRIRNPWGDSTEWQGPWSDGAKEWDELHEAVLKEFDISFSADGEFWV